MKIKSAVSIALFVVALLIIENTARAQIDAKKWLKSKEWNGGISMEADSSVNAVEFYKQYQSNKPVWEKVFSYLKTQNLDTIAPGKYPIDETNAYATITFGPGKELDQAKWESHRNYIDLQYVISGKEKIGVAPVSTATVVKPYEVANDAANYTAEGTYHIASPGTFFLFFPTDAHRPGIKVDGYDKIKKLVIKIRVIN
jgi:biofilm protein TabA